MIDVGPKSAINRRTNEVDNTSAQSAYSNGIVGCLVNGGSPLLGVSPSSASGGRYRLNNPVATLGMRTPAFPLLTPLPNQSRSCAMIQGCCCDLTRRLAPLYLVGKIVEVCTNQQRLKLVGLLERCQKPMEPTFWSQAGSLYQNDRLPPRCVRFRYSGRQMCRRVSRWYQDQTDKRCHQSWLDSNRIRRRNFW